MTPRSLHDLYLYQLRDLYSAKNQLIDALPDFVEKAHDEELKALLRKYLGETDRHRSTLDQVFEMIGENSSGETCHAMKGLVRETRHFYSDVENIFSEDAPFSVMDAGLIANIQRIQHYQIAGFGTVCHYAEVLGRTGDMELLRPILADEKSGDQELNRIATESVNLQAAEVF
jgi:ferritin-like metal-binding protein YciE